MLPSDPGQFRKADTCFGGDPPACDLNPAKLFQFHGKSRYTAVGYQDIGPIPQDSDRYIFPESKGHGFCQILNRDGQKKYLRGTAYFP